MRNTPLIYLVEDEPDLAALMQDVLSSYQYRVQVFNQGHALQAQLEREPPALCIVDLNLPDMDGMSLVRQLESRQIGVIIVSGRNCVTDRVLGLEFGADDYITKPFEPRELVARVQSLMRRLRLAHEPIQLKAQTAEFAGWRYAPDSLTLESPEGVAESLSRAEGDMLLALLKHPFQILSRDQLLGENAVPYDRSIDVRISRLRKKLEADPHNPVLIKTVYGAGYMLACEVAWG